MTTNISIKDPGSVEVTLEITLPLDVWAEVNTAIQSVRHHRLYQIRTDISSLVHEMHRTMRLPTVEEPTNG